MSDIVNGPLFDLACNGGEGLIESFQRLNASYLIRTHQVDPLLIEFEDVSFLAIARCLPNN